jgi:hypothetical protein
LALYLSSGKGKSFSENQSKSFSEKLKIFTDAPEAPEMGCFVVQQSNPTVTDYS